MTSGRKRRLYRLNSYGQRAPASWWECVLHRLGLLGSLR